ncbi:hypothetical protein BGZ80_002221, partial [Entomortierella chlamydospora]
MISPMKLIRTPLRALAQRRYTSAATSSIPATKPTLAVGHSNQKLAIVSGVSAMVGVDVTYAYFTFFQK